MIVGTLLVVVVVVLLCLIPARENDLFFELRIGSDILRTHHAPHVDTYSWVNRGTPWDVPEWGSFVLYALAYRAGGFFGTWLLMTLVTLSAAMMVWSWLVRRISIGWAMLLTSLVLFTLNGTIQERPYVFSYLLLAVSLIIVVSARRDIEAMPAHAYRRLLWLAPLCAVWANLHQGVVVVICVLLAYAVGDAITWRMQSGQRQALLPTVSNSIADASRDSSPSRFGRGGEPERAGVGSEGPGADSALTTLATAFVCGLCAMVSPYGWRIYWNIYITLRDRILMSNVTEWRPATILPLYQLEPFLLTSAVVFGSLALSRRRNLSDALVLIGVFVEAWLHARNMALFVIAGIVIVAPHAEIVIRDLRGRIVLSSSSCARTVAITMVALAILFALSLVTLYKLSQAIGPRGCSPEGIGEAVAEAPSYPRAACDFVKAERFPPNLRILNNFEIGGYLMWQLPTEPVFIDGRLDVYAGRNFDNMLILTRDSGSPAWTHLVQDYDFDCVITTTPREAQGFVGNPEWQLVYQDPVRLHKQRCWIFLRRRPEFAGLITRCLRDRRSIVLA
jgi:hypothetical protein